VAVPASGDAEGTVAATYEIAVNHGYERGSTSEGLQLRHPSD